MHFGIKQRLTAKVTEFERPHCFVDVALKSAFKTLRHVHEFTPAENGTLMRDTLVWVSPLGLLGVVADKLAVKRHMRNFLIERNAALKAAIENNHEIMV